MLDFLLRYAIGRKRLQLKWNQVLFKGSQALEHFSDKIVIFTPLEQIYHSGFSEPSNYRPAQ